MLVVLGCHAFVLGAFAEEKVAQAENRVAQSDLEKLERAKAIVADNAASQNINKNPNSIPWKTEKEGSVTQVGWSMVKSLAVCLGIFLIGVAIYRRFWGKNIGHTARRMRVVERMLIGQRTFINIVEVDGKELLMASGPEHVSFMESLNSSSNATFSESLRTACEKKA